MFYVILGMVFEFYFDLFLLQGIIVDFYYIINFSFGNEF